MFITYLENVKAREMTCKPSRFIPYYLCFQKRRASTNGLPAMRVGAIRTGLAAPREGISTDGFSSY